MRTISKRLLGPAFLVVLLGTGGLHATSTEAAEEETDQESPVELEGVDLDVMTATEPTNRTASTVSSPATLTLTFTEVASVQVEQGINFAMNRLYIGSRDAPVVLTSDGWTGSTPLPATVEGIYLRSWDPAADVESASLFDSCARAAYFVQSRGDKYNLLLWINVDDAANMVKGTTRLIVDAYTNHLRVRCTLTLE